MSTLISHPLLVLVHERGLMSEPDLEAVQGEHNLSGASVHGLLHDQGHVDLATQLELMAEGLHTDVIDLAEVEITPGLIELIPPDIARLYQCVAVGSFDDVLHICLVNPLNPTVIDDLQYQLKKQVVVRIADPAKVEQVIEKQYSKELSYDQIVKEFNHVEAVKDDLTEQQVIEEVGDAQPIVRFVNLVLYQGLREKAADIHFEPFEDSYQIRMKVDGVMKLLTPPPKELASAIASRIKIMANLDIAENRIPQDGRISTVIGGKQLDMRASTLPTQFGESVVLRILDRSSSLLSLNILNIPEKVSKELIHCVEQPNGVFLVTGPTGSGKTTTLYACLRKLNDMETKILTAEDPVEYPIDGIVQVAISEAMGMTFAKALKSFLRQDPDIILVGEIRDLETATIAIQASLTGHLVVSTLHTNSSTEAITRLADMGVQPFLIASSVNGVLAQRLVKTICERCRTAQPLTRDHIDMLKLEPHEMHGEEVFYGAGCEFCNNTGYKGRRGIYEMLMISDPIRAMINESAPGMVLREKAVELGMQTLRMDGLNLMFKGVSSFEQVMKYT